MLAREIHDVAGEIDSVSPAATDPGAMVVNTLPDTHSITWFFYVLDLQNIRIFM